MQIETVSVLEAAHRLAVATDRVYKLVRDRKLPAKKDRDGHWRIPRAAVEERLRRKAALLAVCRIEGR